MLQIEYHWSCQFLTSFSTEL